MSKGTLYCHMNVYVYICVCVCVIHVYTYEDALYVRMVICILSTLFLLIDLYIYEFAYSSGPYSVEVKMTRSLNSHWVAIINTNEHL